MKKLKLRQPRSYHSILKVIRSTDQIIANSASSREHLKDDVYAYDKEIKINLMNWVRHLNEQGVFVNDHLIKEKGRRIKKNIMSESDHNDNPT